MSVVRNHCASTGRKYMSYIIICLFLFFVCWCDPATLHTFGVALHSIIDPMRAETGLLAGDFIIEYFTSTSPRTPTRQTRSRVRFLFFKVARLKNLGTSHWD